MPVWYLWRSTTNWKVFLCENENYISFLFFFTTKTRMFDAHFPLSYVFELWKGTFLYNIQQTLVMCVCVVCLCTIQTFSWERRRRRVQCSLTIIFSLWCLRIWWRSKIMCKFTRLFRVSSIRDVCTTYVQVYVWHRRVNQEWNTFQYIISAVGYTHKQSGECGEYNVECNFISMNSDLA